MRKELDDLLNGPVERIKENVEETQSASQALEPAL